MTDLSKGILMGAAIGTTLTSAFFGHIFNRCDETCHEEWVALCDATDKAACEGRFYSTKLMNKLCREDPAPTVDEEFGEDIAEDSKTLEEQVADVCDEVRKRHETGEAENCFDVFKTTEK